MMVSRFPRQNDAGLRALNVGLWENLVLVVVLVQEGPDPSAKHEGRELRWKKVRKRGLRNALLFFFVFILFLHLLEIESSCKAYHEVKGFVI